MSEQRPPNIKEHVAHNVSFEYFIVDAIMQPPGTKARPRPDRPPYNPALDPSNPNPEVTDPQSDSPPDESKE